MLHQKLKRRKLKKKKMEIEIIKYPLDEDWILVRNNALETQRKHSDKVPSSELKTKFLVSEHSPIRSLIFVWKWIDLPYWVSVHFVRHHIGIEHYVSSQRNDIQKLYNRKQAPQDAPVNHRCVANAQELINMSKARTCINASLETRQAWGMWLNSLKDVAPELYTLCVPPCIYRNGLCPEVFKPCGYNHTKVFEQKLSEYVKYFK
jgi:hypothetical protein